MDKHYKDYIQIGLNIMRYDGRTSPLLLAWQQQAIEQVIR